VTLNKTLNGKIDPSYTWTFTLNGPGVSVTDTTDSTGLVDFNGAKLVPGETYTACEINIPAGFSSNWKLDGQALTAINPDMPQNLGTRCTSFTVQPGQARRFAVDNTRPLGGQRTIGYWKNWNKCSGGNQAKTAAKNGGVAKGFFLVEDLLPQLIGDFNVTSCQQAVKVLSKQDQSGNSKSSDAAYNLAAQLLAAKLNFGAGAKKCTAAQTAVSQAQALLDRINFTGSGNYLPSTSTSPDRATALNLADQLDRYNNDQLCL